MVLCFFYARLKQHWRCDKKEFNLTCVCSVCSFQIHSYMQETPWTKMCHLVFTMAYNQHVSESDISGWLVDNVLLLCSPPGTPHGHDVFPSCGPAERLWGHKGTSSQPDPAALVKCQREGGWEAISGSHPEAWIKAQYGPTPPCLTKCRHKDKMRTHKGPQKCSFVCDT